eukprot:4434283-Pyramimonas_sp.AAC.1
MTATWTFLSVGRSLRPLLPRLLVIGGDWNMSPGTPRSTKFASELQGQLIRAPGRAHFGTGGPIHL